MRTTINVDDQLLMQAKAQATVVRCHHATLHGIGFCWERRPSTIAGTK